jgi:hypothetical protein
VNIVRVRDDHVLGDVLYHDVPVEGSTYYPHTNIDQVVYEHCADLRYVPLRTDEEKLSGSEALNIFKQSTRELFIGGDEIGEWELECFFESNKQRRMWKIFV